jgi:hypothetical protein
MHKENTSTNGTHSPTCSCTPQVLVSYNNTLLFEVERFNEINAVYNVRARIFKAKEILKLINVCVPMTSLTTLT